MSKVFDKSPISIQEQLQLLKDKKLIFNKEEEAIAFLEFVSFFRLKPYLHPFQNVNKGDFKTNTGFEDIIRLYEFDRHLRLLMIDAIERIEVGIRAIINDCMATKYNDAHWYLNKNYFNDKYSHNELKNKIRSLQDKQKVDYQRELNRIKNSKKPLPEQENLQKKRLNDNYTRFYALTYCTPELLPSWAMLEELTMGDLSHLFKGLRDSNKKVIARKLELPSFELLESWLLTITTIRNICTHHGRLWNKELGISPQLPKNPISPWTQKISHDSSKRMYVIFIICHYLMHKINPSNNWSDRLIKLFDEFPEVNLNAMGIPQNKNWKDDFKI